jgi:hypothetical protein
VDLIMTKQKGIWGLVGICVAVLVLSFAGLASDFVTRLMGSLDGLLLLLICLMMAVLFAWMLYGMAKEEGWLPSRNNSREAKSAAANPGSKQPGEGK